MKLDLVSFKLCPFVQSSAITLLRKEIPHDLRYIDLNEPPDWFRAISPNGKAPLLIVDGRDVVFESAVINEFLDEVTPGRLHPTDPLTRAWNRSWIIFANGPLMDSRDLTTVATETQFQDVAARLAERLTQLESSLGDGPYFNGEDFSLVDAVYAPLFMRLRILGRFERVDFLQPFPKLSAWAQALAAEPAVRNSVVADFEVLLENLVRRRCGFLASRLPGGGAPDTAKASRY